MDILTAVPLFTTCGRFTSYMKSAYDLLFHDRLLFHNVSCDSDCLLQTLSKGCIAERYIIPQLIKRGTAGQMSSVTMGSM